MRKNGIKDFKWIFYRQNLGKLLKISFYFYFIGTPLFLKKKSPTRAKNCFPKFFFSFLRRSLLGVFCIKYIYTIIPSVFSPYRVSKRMEMQWNWLKFEIYDLIQSIFWDTLYGENTIQISIYVFGTKGSPKAQPNKEKLFLESNYNA